MSAATDRYSEWDAAYLLGSLSATERREFELHLEECDACASAVAELAGMPGLLSKVPADEAIELLRETDAASVVPDTLLPRLVRSVRRRRLRAVVAVTTGVAAAALAAALLVPLAFQGAAPQQRSAEIALSQVAQGPLRASIRLVPQSWGTRVEMDCHYAGAAGADYGEQDPVGYAMWVTDAAGHATQIATWTAGPGQDAEPAGTTSLTVKQIATVDVRSADSGEVLLRGSP